jgi:hypothetical protein
MPFLAPQFEHDVFVSYSHGDPAGAGHSPLQQWTAHLVGALKADIRAIDPEFAHVDIWFDENIDPTVHLTPELKARVASSAILFVVMSRPYLASSWCKDELQWFQDELLGKSREQGRLFVLRALPTGETKWPDCLCDEHGNPLKGFQFYDLQTGRPYGWRDAETNSKEFVQQLWTLQCALTSRLREIKDREAARAAPVASAVAQSAGNRVYLYARPEDQNLSTTLRERLAAEGLLPLTAASSASQSLADWQAEARMRVAAAKRCRALALVRGNEDERFIGDLLDIGVDERERIQAERGAPLPCALLDDTARDIPIDISGYGIRRFDVTQPDWASQFNQWLASQPRAA